MKNLLLPILLGCGTLIPLHSLQAVTFGDFTPGQTFRMTVTERLTARTKGVKVTKNVAVPDGIPNFHVDDRVKFTIGAKGQLKGPGFSIVFRDDKDSFNTYANRPTFSSPDGSAATVYKNDNNRPVRALLTFYDFKFSGFIPVVTTVDYVLKR